MEGFKEALEKEMSSAVRSMLDKGFGRFKTRYAGDFEASKKDGKQIRGRCYRVTDLKTGETELIVLQDSGGIIGFQELGGLEMTKEEFESVLGERVTDEQYKEIEYVYMYHPVVDCLSTIVKLYQIGGMRLMWDMDAAARQAQQIADRLGVLESQLDELSEEYQRLKKGEKNDDRSDYENG